MIQIAVTPPMPPPRSPLMTPEQILAGANRNGLSASIAAAQAAAFARRDGREPRSASGSSNVDVNASPFAMIGIERSHLPCRSRQRRCLAIAHASCSHPVDSWTRHRRGRNEAGSSGSGSGSQSEAVALPTRSRLPMPPPLPNRPRGRNWDDLEFTRSPPTRPAVAASSQRELPDIPPRTNSPPQLTTTPLQPQSASVRAHAIEVASPSTAAGDGTSQAGPSASSTPSTHINAIVSSSTNVEPASTATATDVHADPARHPAPRRDPSLGLTDFDLLVAQLERPGPLLLALRTAFCHNRLPWPRQTHLGNRSATRIALSWPDRVRFASRHKRG